MKLLSVQTLTKFKFLRMTNPNDGKNVMFFSQKKQFVIHGSAYAEHGPAFPAREGETL